MPTKKLTKAQADRKLVQLAAKRDIAEERARLARHAMYEFMPTAQEAGVTYARQSEIVDLSEIRVAQVLRAERAKLAEAKAKRAAKRKRRSS